MTEEQDHGSVVPLAAPSVPSPSLDAGSATPADRRVHWRCFHCGETFTKAQARWAREHFGANEDALPVCQMRIPGEHHLLTLLRKQEAELAAHRAEDTDLWRSLYSQSADHATALIREEERGYEKGVRDARAEGADVLAALEQTWRVLRSAGTLNLTRGVQIGQTSWYVKISDAEEASDAAIAAVRCNATEDGSQPPPASDGEARDGEAAERPNTRAAS